MEKDTEIETNLHMAVIMHNGNTEKEQRQCCEICKVNRVLHLFAIAFCIITFAVCYLMTKNLSTQCANDIFNMKVKTNSLQSQLSALDQRIQKQNQFYGGKLQQHDDKLSKNQSPSFKDLVKLSRKKRNGLKEKQNETSVRQKRRKSNKKRKRQKKTGTIAVQFEGRGGIQSGFHEHFAGTFTKWKLAGFVKKASQFVLNPNNGSLTIKKKGLYLIFAQVTLMGNGNLGYYVQKAGTPDPILTCWSNTDPNNDNNLCSCTTIGLVNLKPNTVLYIKHADDKNGKALFDSNASFFGMVKF